MGMGKSIKKVVTSLLLALPLLLLGCDMPFSPPNEPERITGQTIEGIELPRAGNIPVTSIIATSEYAGTVTWLPSHEKFLPDTEYTASITLTVKDGYTFKGVPENSFIVTGALSANNAANSGVIQALFAKTSTETISLLQIPSVTIPTVGAIPSTGPIVTDQYTGTISWSPEHSAFEGNTVYVATITLTPKNGFTLAGILANSFTVDGATEVTHLTSSGVITATFPSTGSVPISLYSIPSIVQPIVGATPVTTAIDTSQYTGTISWDPEHAQFAGNTTYVASVSLTPKAGFTLTGVPANSFTVDGASTVTHSANSGIVTVQFPNTSATPISIFSVMGIIAPEVNASPDTTPISTSQYTGTISWSPEHSQFAGNTSYTATITLTPKSGYTLAGVPANSFTISGASSVTHSANSGIITAIFPNTANAPISLYSIPSIVQPVVGATPVTSAITTSQYTGTISWSPEHSQFIGNTAYSATITLTAKSNFTLSGVPANSFTVDGASSVTHSSNSGVVTATFPSTTAAPITLYDIPNIVQPVVGATPVTTAINTPQYTGAVSWSLQHSIFKGNIVYSASITLSPKNGYTLSGVPANSFSVNGASSVTHTTNSGVITATFPPTLKSTDASILDLTFINLSEGVELTPSFNSNIYDYSLDLDYNYNYLNMEPSFYFNSTYLPVRDVFNGFPLNVGTNIIPIEVTAQDGITKKTYTFTVIRRPLYEGPLDHSFGTNGKVLIPPAVVGKNVEISGFDIDSNNEIIISLMQYNANSTFDSILFKYNSSGSPVTSFGTNGKRTLISQNTHTCFTRIDIQSDNKIVTFRSSVINSNWEASIQRLLPNGTQDNTFGTDSIVSLPVPYNQSHPRQITVTDSGLIYILGGIAGSMDDYLGRYLANGDLDSTFGNNGFINLSEESVTWINSFAIQPDGKILVAGYYNPEYNTGGKNKAILARYLTNGIIDTSFGTAGQIVTMFSQDNDSEWDSVQVDVEKIYAYTPYQRAISRFNLNGQLDFSYGNDNGSPSFNGSGMAIQPDGKALFVSSGKNSRNSSEYVLKLWRRNTDGSPDDNYNISPNGQRHSITYSIQTPIAGEGLPNQKILIQPDGKILVLSTVSNNGVGIGLVRYLPNQ